MEVYVVKAISQLDEQSRAEFDIKEWKEGVGMVLVHYIGGREDEDEWIPKDSLRLREDKMAERHIMMERLRLQVPAADLQNLKTTKTKPHSESKRCQIPVQCVLRWRVLASDFAE